MKRVRDVEGITVAILAARIRFAVCDKLAGEYIELLKSLDGLNAYRIKAVINDLLGSADRVPEPLAPLPKTKLGAWDRRKDEHLLQTSLGMTPRPPVVTEEKKNLQAAPVVYAVLGVEVHGVQTVRSYLPAAP